MAAQATGSCLCGNVQFAFSLPSLWCGHCHCSLCRQAHGAPFVTWVGVRSDSFRITAGGDSLARYVSSPGAVRSFCQRCGSTLLFESERWPGETHVARANVHGDIDRAPQAHAFFTDKASWVTVNDGLPRRGGQSGTEVLP